MHDMMEVFGLIVKVILLLVMCRILLRMLGYFRYQVTCYYHSRHIERFLEKKGKSAEEYLEENRYLWHHSFANAPHLRGGGTKAFIWALLCKARFDIAKSNLENSKRDADLVLMALECGDLNKVNMTWQDPE